MLEITPILNMLDLFNKHLLRILCSEWRQLLYNLREIVVQGGWSYVPSCVRPVHAGQSCTCPFVVEHHKWSGLVTFSGSVWRLPNMANKGFLYYTLNQWTVIIYDIVKLGQCGADERQNLALFLNESSQAGLKTWLHLNALICKTKCW